MTKSYSERFKSPGEDRSTASNPPNDLDLVLLPYITLPLETLKYHESNGRSTTSCCKVNYLPMSRRLARNLSSKDSRALILSHTTCHLVRVV